MGREEKEIESTPGGGFGVAANENKWFCCVRCRKQGLSDGEVATVHGGQTAPSRIGQYCSGGTG